MNKSLLGTDIFSEVLTDKQATRQIFGHYSIAALSVTEIVSEFTRAHSTAGPHSFHSTR